jgi:hypothetical protein
LQGALPFAKQTASEVDQHPGQSGSMNIPRSTRRRVGWFVAGMAGLAAILLAAGLIFRGEYETEQSASRTFRIAQDFSDVRKILVRKHGAEQIVTMGGTSEFISQKWSNVGGDVGTLDFLNPDWRLQLHGTLRVRTKDDYIGQHDIDLEQDVVIEVDFLHSEVELDKPAERLRDYRMTTHFDRDPAGGTRVELKLTQRILTDAPWFAHGIADRRVRASVEKTLVNQEAAIQRFIAENIDDVPLLPLR